jgi:murein DD-endopeptidase MepM/ murein hydrolase activator NlpD
MALRLIGVDLPDPDVDPVGGQLTETQDISGDVLNQANRTLQTSLDVMAKGTDLRRKMSNEMTENKVAIEQKAADNAARVADVAGRKQQQFAQEMSSLNQNLAQFQDINLRRQEALALDQARKDQAYVEQLKANQKTASEIEMAAAMEEMEKLRLQGQTLIPQRDGMTNYQKLVAEVPSRYKNLTAEQVQQLTKYGYDTAYEVKREQVKKTVEYTEKVANQQRDLDGVRLVNKILPNLVALEYPGMDETKRQELETQLSADIQSYVAGLGPIDDLSRINMLTVATKALQESGVKGLRGTVYAQKAIDNINAYADSIAPLVQDVQEGTISTESYLQQREVLRKKHFIQGDVGFDDPLASLQFQNRQLGLNAENQDLRTRGQNAALMQLDANPYMVSDHIASILFEGKSLDVWEYDKAVSNTPVAKTIVRVAKLYRDFETKQVSANKNLAKIDQAVAAVKKGDAAAAASYMMQMENNANNGNSTDMYARILGIPVPERVKADPKALQGWIQERFKQSEASLQGLMTERGAIIDEVTILRNQLAPYGLANGYKGWEDWKKANASKRQAEQKRMQGALESGAAGAPSPFSGGGRVSGTSLKSDSVRDPQTGETVKVVLPVPAGSSLRFHDTFEPGFYGASRSGGQRSHQGIDISNGTDNAELVVSVRSGKVAHAGWLDGYGNTVIINHDDGHSTMYAHLSGIGLKKGQNVWSGSSVGRMGRSGGNYETHLHFEVIKGMQGDNISTGEAVNPLSWLAQQAGQVTTAKPRNNTSTTTKSSFKLPLGAFYLGNGEYIYKSQKHKVPGYVQNKGGTAGPQGGKPVKQSYNKANPIREGQWSSNRDDYGKNDVNDNYGYKALAQDRAFRNEIVYTANRLGIPAVWLVDLMAFETGGTFNTNVLNQGGSGAFGLIQFMPDTASAVGAHPGQTRVQQMAAVYRYLEPFKNVLNRGPEWALAAVWGGQALVSKLEQGTAPDNYTDGDITWGEYKQALGVHAGRRYRYGGSSGRRARLTETTHTAFTRGCSTCNALVQSGSEIIAHVPTATGLNYIA